MASLRDRLDHAFRGPLVNNSLVDTVFSILTERIERLNNHESDCTGEWVGWQVGGGELHMECSSPVCGALAFIDGPLLVELVEAKEAKGDC